MKMETTTKVKNSKTENKVVFKAFKKAETSGNIKINLPKSLLDEYYEKYCEKSQNPQNLRISKSLKIKRSRTEERLNEVSREQDELIEACQWLFRAGFLKYIELFENNQFPIDLNKVKTENQNLNDIELKAINRRLEVLNKCSEMKVDYEYIRNNYENQNDDEDDEDNDLEMSLTRVDSMFMKKKQKQSIDALKVPRRGDTAGGGSFKSQLRPKQSIQRYHSFQNRFRTVKGTAENNNNNDGYADDIEDNGDDESSLLLSRRAKIYSLQPVSFSNNNDLLLKAEKSFKQLSSTIKPISKASEMTTSNSLSSFRPADIILKAVNKSSDEKILPIPPKTSQSFNKIQTISTLVNSDEPKLSNYCIEDNNGINLAFVKLIKRKRQPEGSYILSIYDNVEVVKDYLTVNKNEIESDDSLFNTNSTLNSKINNQMIASTSTFSTNSSNHSSPAINNKIQNFKPPSTDNEIMLPKIYLNEDEDDERNFIDNKPERRDSGVGKSLTRELKMALIVKTKPKMEINSLNVLKFADLKKIALVKITALMEEYCQTCQKSGWNRLRSVPKFLKAHQRSINENDIKNKNVFGVPFKINIQRHGIPLPQPITYIMNYIRKYSANTEGVFRKAGLKKRTQEIRDEIEKNTSNLHIEKYINTSGFSSDSETNSSNDVIDAADLFKQYFRELPECLMTNKLSQTLTEIFTSKLPKEQWLEAVQYCMILLEDEHRDVLQLVLETLNQIAQNSVTNLMTSINIARILAPTLMQMKINTNFQNFPLTNISNKDSQTSSSNSNEKTTAINASDPIIACVTLMIENYQKIFQVPQEAFDKIVAKSFEYQYPVLIRERVERVKMKQSSSEKELFRSYLNDRIEENLKELKEKSRNWTNFSKTETDVEIYYKKLDDGIPLRFWKIYIEIDAPAKEVFEKLYNEKMKWDDNISNFNILEALDPQIDIIKYDMHLMSPYTHATRSNFELRTNKQINQSNHKNIYIIYSTSIEIPNEESITAVTIRNCYIIESNDNKTKLYRLYRGDFKGHSTDWYNKMQGHILKKSLIKLKNIFNTKKNYV